MSLHIETDLMGASSITNNSPEEMRRAAVMMVAAAMELGEQEHIKAVLSMIGVEE